MFTARLAVMGVLVGVGMLGTFASGSSNMPAEHVDDVCPSPVSVSIAGPPQAMAVTPNERFAMVTGDNAVSVIDLKTKSLANTIAVGSDPLGIDVNRNGTAAYVSSGGSGTIAQIDMRSQTVSKEITIGGFPNGVAVRTTAGGDELYVSDMLGDAALLVDAATGNVLQRWAITGPAGIVLTSDDSVVVPSSVDSDVLVINARDKTAVTLHRPDRSSTNLGSFSATGTIVPLPGDVTTWLDTATNSFSGELEPIEPGVTSHAALTANRKYTLVTTRDFIDAKTPQPGKLSVVTTRDAQEVATIQLGLGPRVVSTAHGLVLVGQGPALNGGSTLELIPDSTVFPGKRCTQGRDQ